MIDKIVISCICLYLMMNVRCLRYYLLIMMMIFLTHWLMSSGECADTEGGRVVEVEEFSSSAGLVRKLYGVAAHTHLAILFEFKSSALNFNLSRWIKCFVYDNMA